MSPESAHPSASSDYNTRDSSSRTDLYPRISAHGSSARVLLNMFLQPPRLCTILDNKLVGVEVDAFIPVSQESACEHRSHVDSQAYIVLAANLA